MIVSLVSEFSGPLSAADLALFAELLVGLVRAKLPLPEALRLLARDADSRRLRESLSAVEKDVASGTPLGEALRRRERDFPPLFTRLIDQGIASNDLHAALVELVREFRSQARFREALWSQLLSPIATATVLGTLLFVVLFSQLPVLYGGIYKQLRIEIPLPTRFAFWASDLLHRPSTAIAALGALGILLALAILVCMRVNLRRNFQMFALSLPFIGPFLKAMLLGRFCRLLGILLHRRIPLDAALELTRDCFQHLPMNKAIDVALIHVRNGACLEEALGNCPLFPPTLLQFVAGAQLHGDLPETLFRLADLYEQRGELDGARVRYLIYVVAQISVGIAVATVVISFLLPMFRVHDMLRTR